MASLMSSVFWVFTQTMTVASMQQSKRLQLQTQKIAIAKFSNIRLWKSLFNQHGFPTYSLLSRICSPTKIVVDQHGLWCVRPNVGLAPLFMTIWSLSLILDIRRAFWKIKNAQSCLRCDLFDQAWVGSMVLFSRLGVKDVDDDFQMRIQLQH